MKANNNNIITEDYLKMVASDICTDIINNYHAMYGEDSTWNDMCSFLQPEDLMPILKERFNTQENNMNLNKLTVKENNMQDLYLSKEELNVLEYEIQNHEFERNGKTFSLGFDYTDTNHLVVWNETDNKRHARYENNDYIFDKLPKYVIEQIQNAIKEHYSIRLTVNDLIELVTNQLLKKSILVNEFGFNDIVAELYDNQKQGISPRKQLEYIISESIPEGRRENYFTDNTVFIDTVTEIDDINVHYFNYVFEIYLQLYTQFSFEGDEEELQNEAETKILFIKLKSYLYLSKEDLDEDIKIILQRIIKKIEQMK